MCDEETVLKKKLDTTEDIDERLEIRRQLREIRNKKFEEELKKISSGGAPSVELTNDINTRTAVKKVESNAENDEESLDLLSYSTAQSLQTLLDNTPYTETSKRRKIRARMREVRDAEFDNAVNDLCRKEKVVNKDLSIEKTKTYDVSTSKPVREKPTKLYEEPSLREPVTDPPSPVQIKSDDVTKVSSLKDNSESKSSVGIRGDQRRNSNNDNAKDEVQVDRHENSDSNERSIKQNKGRENKPPSATVEKVPQTPEPGIDLEERLKKRRDSCGPLSLERPIDTNVEQVDFRKSLKRKSEAPASNLERKIEEAPEQVDFRTVLGRKVEMDEKPSLPEPVTDPPSPVPIDITKMYSAKDKSESILNHQLYVGIRGDQRRNSNNNSAKDEVQVACQENSDSNDKSIKQNKGGENTPTTSSTGDKCGLLRKERLKNKPGDSYIYGYVSLEKDLDTDGAQVDFRKSLKRKSEAPATNLERIIDPEEGPEQVDFRTVLSRKVEMDEKVEKDEKDDDEEDDSDDGIRQIDFRTALKKKVEKPTFDKETASPVQLDFRNNLVKKVQTKTMEDKDLGCEQKDFRVLLGVSTVSPTTDSKEQVSELEVTAKTVDNSLQKVSLNDDKENIVQCKPKENVETKRKEESDDDDVDGYVRNRQVARAERSRRRQENESLQKAKDLATEVSKQDGENSNEEEIYRRNRRQSDSKTERSTRRNRRLKALGDSP